MSWRDRALKEGLKHLQEKYGEEFIYIGPHTPSQSSVFGYNSASQVTCSSFPEGKIVMDYVRSDSGDITYYDNYMAYYYRDQLRDTVLSFVEQVYGKGKIYYTVHDRAIYQEMDKNTSFETYASFRDYKLFTIILDQDVSSVDSREEDVARIAQALADHRIVCRIRIYYAKHEAYAEINEANYEIYTLSSGFVPLKSWCSFMCRFELSEEFDANSLRWEEP